MDSKNKKVSFIDASELTPARLETLVDGVFAIAMTLLVLEIHVPQVNIGASQGEFVAQLLKSSPSLLSYMLSFIILGMFWVAHHLQFRYIKKISNTLIWINILYLMFICMLPFYAQLLGLFYNRQLAVVLYGLHLIWLVLFHFWMWQHVKARPNLQEQFLYGDLDKLVKRATFLGVFAYLAAIAISFISLKVSLIIYLITPLPYIFGWIYNLV